MPDPVELIDFVNITDDIAFSHTINSDMPFTLTHSGWDSSSSGGQTGLIVIKLPGTTLTTQNGACDTASNPIAALRTTCNLIRPNTVGTSVSLGVLEAGDYLIGIYEGNNNPSTNEVTLQLTAVPLPAAVWLFGSALMGLGVVARRRKLLAA